MLSVRAGDAELASGSSACAGYMHESFMNLYLGGALARLVVRGVQDPTEELARSAREQLALCAPASCCCHHWPSSGCAVLCLCCPPLVVPSPGPCLCSLP